MEKQDKYTLSINEAAEYFGIGQKRLRQFCREHPESDFLLWVGNHARIKKNKFERFLDGLNTI